MGNIDEAVQHYINAIKETEVYREYERQKERVKQYPELKAQIDEFRLRNYELQTSRDNAFEKIDNLEREYDDFRENPLVADFLAAELAFCRMMQGIHIRVTEALEFE